ncbi:sensor histidine kinase [Novipirellula galeiformis]|nr:HAMP domain-containing sensor histidine kinase [Novipirellula galeiformis]
MIPTTPLLPNLRFQSFRWWLPRSLVATETLMRLLLRSADASSDRHVDPVTLQQTVQCLRADPPLLIFAVASFPGDPTSGDPTSGDPTSGDPTSGDPTSGDSTSLSNLATWLANNAVTLFANGDAFLAAPTITSQTRARWSELDAYFQTIPLDRWISEASLWLEATGPSLPSAWQQRWANVCVQDEAVSSSRVVADASGTAGDSLQQLARQIEHTGVLERSFDQQIHQRKLASLKQFAYGLSHEINNPLANISTRAQQLKQGEADPQRNASLQKIVDQVYRAHEMIADLMFYANPSLPEPSPCDLGQLLLQIADEFVVEVDSLSIRLETEVPLDAVLLDVDSTMIGEVMRVLLRNAIEAIGSSGAIMISIVDQSDRVLIDVADSGPGLSRGAREHAFDPYFSGREAGRGLGLGLCRAYRVIKLHDGEITLSGGPSGCVATISLPR